MAIGQTWQCNLWCSHGVGNGDVELNVEFVFLEVDNVPAFSKPPSSFLVRLESKPIEGKFNNKSFEKWQMMYSGDLNTKSSLYLCILGFL